MATQLPLMFRLIMKELHHLVEGFLVLLNIVYCQLWKACHVRVMPQQSLTLLLMLSATRKRFVRVYVMS
ncbi:hypothetical protein COOONC_20626 [Cooperia oncophora]